MALVIQARELFTPVERVERPLLFIEDRSVVKMVSSADCEIPHGARVIDLGDATLAPGFIDMHIHGGAGHDVMEGSADALPALEKLLFQPGVTTYFPTTVTAPVDQTLSALEKLADAIEQADGTAGNGRAKPAGHHLEGPFLRPNPPGGDPPA